MNEQEITSAVTGGAGSDEGKQLHHIHTRTCLSMQKASDDIEAC